MWDFLTLAALIWLSNTVILCGVFYLAYKLGWLKGVTFTTNGLVKFPKRKKER